MAALGEVPFGRYYGSVDSTPLFVLLAGAYYERTGDRRVDRVDLAAISSGRSTGSTLRRRRRRRLRRVRAAHVAKDWSSKGWKDSQDSVFHADGDLAEAPIALVRGAGLRLRRPARGGGAGPGAGATAARPRRWRARPRRSASASRRRSGARTVDLRAGPRRREAPLRGAFVERRAVPLHRHRAPGAGAAGRPIAARARTCSPAGASARSTPREARYNPMSYHNGSVWPHDNALIAAGFARYGFGDAVGPVLTGTVRREPVLRSAPHAGAVLRFSRAPRRRPDALSRGLLAAGLGGGQRVPAAAGGPGPHDCRPGSNV